MPHLLNLVVLYYDIGKNQYKHTYKSCVSSCNSTTNKPKKVPPTNQPSCLSIYLFNFTRDSTRLPYSTHLYTRKQLQENRKLKIAANNNSNNSNYYFYYYFYNAHYYSYSRSSSLLWPDFRLLSINQTQ